MLTIPKLSLLNKLDYWIISLLSELSDADLISELPGSWQITIPPARIISHYPYNLIT